MERLLNLTLPLIEKINDFILLLINTSRVTKELFLFDIRNLQIVFVFDLYIVYL